MPGKFEIYKDKKGEFRFRLKSSNGQNILASEGYKAKATCKNGIESVRKNSASLSNFEKKDTKAGKFAFNLKAANKQVIGTSQSYATAASRDAGIKSVKTTAAKATVDDTTVAAKKAVKKATKSPAKKAVKKTVKKVKKVARKVARK